MDDHGGPVSDSTLPAARSNAEPAWLDRALWPYPGRRVATSDGAVHLTDVGEGAPVVFVHGTPTWSIDWRHLIGSLAEDHRCIALDHLGFGLSERPTCVGYRPEDHARRFAEVLDALDLRGITLVVHDVGGPIALPWALDHLDRIARVVVVNSWCGPFTGTSERLAARVVGGPLGRLLYRWLNVSLTALVPSAWADRSRLTAELHAQLEAPFDEDPSARVRVLWAIARGLLGSEAHYAAVEARLAELVQTPVDIVWGLQDSTLAPHHLEAWERAVPHARVTRVEEAGHWPHEEAPQTVLGVLRRRESLAAK